MPDPTRITIEINPRIESFLIALVLTGLYGKTVQEAAERALSRGIESSIHSGLLRRGEHQWEKTE